MGWPRIAQPVDVPGDQPEVFGHIVQHAVIVVENPFPDHGDRYGTGDHRQVENAPEEGCVAVPHFIDQRCHPQGKHTGDRHADQHDDNRVDQRLAEDGILEHFDVIGQTDPAEIGHGVIEKAGDQAHAHGENHEAQEEDQAGRHEEISGDVFPPARCSHGRGNHPAGGESSGRHRDISLLKKDRRAPGPEGERRRA